MIRRLIAPVLAGTLILTACDGGGTTAPPQQQLVEQDYALAMFGEAGAALQGTLGTQDTRRPFDGRSGWRPFPDSIALSDEQKAEIEALRTAFRTANGPALDSLRAIFVEAREARAAGATREEVRAILMTGRPLALRLRLAVVELHIAIWGVFTDQQKLWILAHRPHLPLPIARP